MAHLKITGLVRSFAEGDDGRIHLGIDDAEKSKAAEFYVHDMKKSFNPTSQKHGFGAKEVACNVEPGFASYRIVIDKDQAKGISHGSYVELVLDVFNVRKVRFYQRRWTSIPNLEYALVSVKPVGEKAASGGK